MRLKVRLGSAEMARVCRLSNQITAMDEQNAYFNVMVRSGQRTRHRQRSQ